MDWQVIGRETLVLGSGLTGAMAVILFFYWVMGDDD